MKEFKRQFPATRYGISKSPIPPGFIEFCDTIQFFRCPICGRFCKKLGRHVRSKDKKYKSAPLFNWQCRNSACKRDLIAPKDGGSPLSPSPEQIKRMTLRLQELRLIQRMEFPAESHLSPYREPVVYKLPFAVGGGVGRMSG